MKTYKINGKEISEAYEGLHVSGDYLAGKINQLLEALSDNNDECNCCGWDDHGYTHEPGCNLKKALSDKEEEKQEEYIDGIPVKNWSHTKEEIRKAKSLKEGITELVRNKQSTSLKEGITEIVSRSISVHTITDSVLKLIQSHLIKEIELERIKNDYIELRQDEIINIINNL